MKKTLLFILFINTALYSSPVIEKLSFKNFITKVNKRYIRIENEYEKADAEKEYQLTESGYELLIGAERDRSSSYDIDLETSFSIKKEFNYGTTINFSSSLKKDYLGYSFYNESYDYDYNYYNNFNLSVEQSLKDIKKEKNKVELVESVYQNTLIKSDDLRNEILFSSSKEYFQYFEYKKNIEILGKTNKYLEKKLSTFNNLTFQQEMDVNVIKNIIEKNLQLINELNLKFINQRYALYYILGEEAALIDYEFEDILNIEYVKQDINNFEKNNTNINEKLLQNKIEYSKLKIKEIDILKLPDIKFIASSYRSENEADLTKFGSPNNSLAINLSYDFFNKKSSKDIALKSIYLESFKLEYKELQIKNENILKRYKEVLNQKEQNLKNTIALNKRYKKNSDLRFELLSLLIEKNSSINTQVEKIEKEIQNILSNETNINIEIISMNLDYLAILRDYNSLFEIITQ